MQFLWLPDRHDMGSHMLDFIHHIRNNCACCRQLACTLAIEHNISLGITEPVSSPTFTIVQTYDEGRIPFYHFDVYRIGDVEEMEEIGFDEYIFGEGVCLIEWANLIEEILPPHYQTVRIEKVLEKGFDYRMITIEAEGELQ